jgi:formate-dependent nitrite reductase membrane component NrfD
MNTLSSFEMSSVSMLKSGVGFSDIEAGVSTGAGSGCLMVVVNIRNVRTTEKRSTIGVMSICGDFVGNLIFGIVFLISYFGPKDKFSP